MHPRILILPWLLALCLALPGCGGDGEAKPDASGTRANEEKPNPGELVIAPSASTLTPSEKGPAALEVLTGLINSDELAVPEGFSARLDESFEQHGRLRLVVTPDHDAKDEAVKQAAAEVYAALETVFAERAEAALAAEHAQLQTRIQAAAESIQRWQREVVTYAQNRRGLPDTKESHLEKRRLDKGYKDALALKIELDKELVVLERQVDRKRFTTLTRIR